MHLHDKRSARDHWVSNACMHDACQESLHAAIASVALTSVTLLIPLLSLYSSIIFASPNLFPHSSRSGRAAFIMTDNPTYLRSFEIPDCFCGHTAVVIHVPLWPSTRTQSYAISDEESFYQNESPDTLISNWVYECHFSPQQQGAALYLPCRKHNLDTRQAEGETSSGSKFEIPERPRRLWPELGWSRVNAAGSTKDYHSPSKKAREQAAPIATWIGMPPPTSRFGQEPCTVKVCGFHMHAIEWHAIEEMKDKGDNIYMLALAERAGCPRFNLSLTRWLDVGLNSLVKLPFTDVNCFCNIPMVVSCMQAMLPRQSPTYSLVCAHRDVRDSTAGLNSCSRVIPVDMVKYDARSSPVHEDPLSSDLWLQWVAGQNRPPEYYFFDPDVGDGPKSILVSRIKSRLNFSKPPRSPSPSASISKNFSALWYRSSRIKPSFVDPVLSVDSSALGLVTSQGLKATASSATISFNTDDRLCGGNMNNECSSLEILSGPQPYKEVIDPLRLFGIATSPPGLLERHIHDAVSSMMHWNNRQEAEDFHFAEGMRARNQVNKELTTMRQREHADLLLQMTNMTANASLMARIKCKVCYEGTLTEFLLPCGHMVLCKNCLRQVSVCPICRRPPVRTQRISWGSKVGGAELGVSERLDG